MTTATMRQTVATTFSGPTRIWALIAGMAAVALVGYLGLVSMIAPFTAPRSIPWPLLALGFAVAEVYVIHLEFRADSHSFSLNEVPLVLGLFFVSPGELILAQAVGAGTVLLLHRRQPALKLCFNVVNTAIGTGVAILTFHGFFAAWQLVLPTPDPIGPPGWIAAIAAVLVAEQVVASNVVTAISLSQPGSVNRRQIVRIGSIFAGANTCLGLVAVTLVWLHPIAVLLPTALSVVLILAYNAYAAELRKRKSMDILVESTRIAHDSARIESVTRTLLGRARDMFVAEHAEMLLVSDLDEPGARFILEANGDFRVESVPVLDPRAGVWQRVVAGGRAVRLARPIEDERLRRHYEERGMRDLMAAPIRRGDAIIGKILVANRRSDVVTFSSDDLHLFETLANHASISLQNGRLVDELRQQLAENQHQALHDALTGLPNRTLFRQRLEEAVAARASGQNFAVVMMDLDHFKEINDTLGHHVGDMLLQQVARRLDQSVASSTTVARLSGDEFGLLISQIRGPLEAVARAQQILGTLGTPFAVEELTLEVGGSAGVALCPEHGEDADTLLRHADVAMYLAKEARSGVEVYSPDRDQHSPGRLALSGEIRRALEKREMIVFYQPKVDFKGHVVGAEALVRWQHQRDGLVLPDDFIAMAEHTGLIRPLTLFVVEEAARQCHAWRQSGNDLHVAVNLSIRSLLDIELPDGIASILERYPIPASCVQLEITESVIMADTARTESVLERLHAMGLGISIDDFGTGLSSYERLQRLPVNELKIDRSFVLGMDAGGKAEKIVRSIVDLGHNLGLRVVAEGVETPAAWKQLRRLGCDVAQGYLIGRPVPAEQFSELLGPASVITRAGYPRRARDRQTQLARLRKH
ncbi:MAG: EAL domain-containing protein [Chloroflexota bacterium]|nr:EAL domain-containing protein [Chloroflexota bacterium]